jgi:signal transduction histidine kinase
VKAPRTLVARLAWWFAGSLLALYGIPAALVYVYASAQAQQYAELTLKTEAEALAAYVAGSGNFDAPELREPEETPIPIWLRILENGSVVAETPGTPRLPPLPEPPGATPVVEVAFLPTRPAYAVVRHQIGGRTPGLRVEAIGSLEPLQRSKHRLATGLILVGLVIIPLAALGGRALSQRALRPIGDLVEAIRGLDPDRRERRLELPDSVVEEVSVLSRAFNVLLGRLEESVERMRRFTADASHEIRNPLSVLRTGLEIALRRDRSVGEYQELLRENLQEIDRLHAVVEGLLLLARDVPGSGLRLASSPLDLGEVVRATAAFFADSAAESGIRIDARIEPGISVSGDAALLRLVVFNLIDNALKHSPKGEVLQVEVRREGERAVLLVADRGPGVQPADRERVFERFFRGGPASGSGVGGLGLSVVRWVAEAHGGTARLLDSERGAAFEVSLPAEPSLQTSPEPPGPT